MRELNIKQEDILIIIGKEPNRPSTEVKEELSEYYERDIQKGLFYPNVDVLVEKGLVREETDNRKPEEREYSITQRGRELLQKQQEFRENVGN